MISIYWDKIIIQVFYKISCNSKQKRFIPLIDWEPWIKKRVNHLSWMDGKGGIKGIS